MRSRSARNIIHNLSDGEKAKLLEHIELQRTKAILMGRRIDTKLLQFIQAEIDNQHPKALEPNKIRPRSGRCRIIRNAY